MTVPPNHPQQRSWRAWSVKARIPGTFGEEIEKIGEPKQEMAGAIDLIWRRTRSFGMVLLIIA
jgi:hypothetical protein